MHNSTSCDKRGAETGDGRRETGDGRRPASPWQHTARLAYLGVIALATLTSLHLRPDLAEAFHRLIRAIYPRIHTQDVVDIVRNFALFAGWGCVWAVTARDRDTRTLLSDATLSGFVISLGVETVQLFSRYRQSSILDIGANTAGALGGAAAVLFAVHVARKYRDRDSYIGVPAFTFFGSYLVAVSLQAMVFTRSSLRGGAYGNPLERIVNVLQRFELSSITHLAVRDALWFMPLGAFAVAMLNEAGWRGSKAVWRTTAGGLVLSVALEVLRAPLGLDMSAGAVVMHAVGVTLGAIAAAGILPIATEQLDNRRRTVALATVYAALLAVRSWQPFRFETSPRTILDQLSLASLVPLHAEAFRGLYSVATITAPFFLFLPVGGLLAVWPMRRTGWLGYCLPGIYLAVVTELVQIVLAGKYFSGTDLMVQCAGVGVGYVVLRLAGYGVAGELVGMRERA